MYLCFVIFQLSRYWPNNNSRMYVLENTGIPSFLYPASGYSECTVKYLLQISEYHSCNVEFFQGNLLTHMAYSLEILSWFTKIIKTRITYGDQINYPVPVPDMIIGVHFSKFLNTN